MDSGKRRGGIFLSKGWLGLVCAGFTLGLMFILAVAVYMLGVRGDTNDLVSELSDRGWPATLAELNDWYEQPPAGENAALLYIEAAKLSNLAGNPSDVVMRWMEDSKVTVEELTAVDQYLMARAAAIAMARKAMAFPSSRYPVDYTTANADPAALLLPWQAQWRVVARLLAMESTAHAAHGDAAAAVDSLHNAFHLAQSTREAPTLIAGLVRIAIFTHAVQGLERVLARVDLTEIQLAELEDAAASAFDVKSMEWAFAGELCLVLESSWFADDFRFVVDRIRYVSILKTFLEAGSQSPEALLTAIDELEREKGSQVFERLLTPMSANVTPALTRSVQAFLESVTRYRAMRIGLAVEKYRVRLGQLPDTLDALEPDFLTPLPQTVFGGGPFQYTIQGSGYTIEGPDSGQSDRGPILFTVTRVEEL
jgi:hypothetical protein